MAKVNGGQLPHSLLYCAHVSQQLNLCRWKSAGKQQQTSSILEGVGQTAAMLDPVSGLMISGGNKLGDISENLIGKNSDGTTRAGGFAVNKGFKGAGVGAAYGLRAGGPIGAAIGAGAGFAVGGGYGLIKGSSLHRKEKDAIDEAKRIAKLKNLNSQFNEIEDTENQAYLKRGGKKMKYKTGVRVIETEGREPIFSGKQKDGTRKLLFYNPSLPNHSEGGVKLKVTKNKYATTPNTIPAGSSIITAENGKNKLALQAYKEGNHELLDKIINSMPEDKGKKAGDGKKKVRAKEDLYIDPLDYNAREDSRDAEAYFIARAKRLQSSGKKLSTYEQELVDEYLPKQESFSPKPNLGNPPASVNNTLPIPPQGFTNVNLIGKDYSKMQPGFYPSSVEGKGYGKKPSPRSNIEQRAMVAEYKQNPTSFKKKYGNYATTLQKEKLAASNAGKKDFTFSKDGKLYNSGLEIAPESPANNLLPNPNLPNSGFNTGVTPKVGETTSTTSVTGADKLSQGDGSDLLSTIPSIAEIAARASVLNSGIDKVQENYIRLNKYKYASQLDKNLSSNQIASNSAKKDVRNMAPGSGSYLSNVGNIVSNRFKANNEAVINDTLGRTQINNQNVDITNKEQGINLELKNQYNDQKAANRGAFQNQQIALGQSVDQAVDAYQGNRQQTKINNTLLNLLDTENYIMDSEGNKLFKKADGTYSKAKKGLRKIKYNIKRK